VLNNRLVGFSQAVAAVNSTPHAATNMEDSPQGLNAFPRGPDADLRRVLRAAGSPKTNSLMSRPPGHRFGRRIARIRANEESNVFLRFQRRR